MKRLFNAILFWVALVMAAVFIPVGAVYGVIRNLLKHGPKKAARLYNDKRLMQAISIDKLGNVAAPELWEDLFTVETGINYPFGHHDDTLSEVLGRNERSTTLSSVGTIISQILNWMDHNHVEDAIGPDVDGYLRAGFYGPGDPAPEYNFRAKFSGAEKLAEQKPGDLGINVNQKENGKDEK